ncbi:MAG: C25 family cysteine peptidase, partial [Flavobacteriales bacterium]
MKKSLKFGALAFLFFAAVAQTSAQKQLVSKYAVGNKDGKAVRWMQPVSEVKYDGSSKTYLLFEGAVFLDETSLPHVVQNVPVSGSNSVKPRLENVRFEPLSVLERAAITDIAIGDEVELKVSRYTERKQTFVRISFIPLRRNTTTGAVEKLVSYKLVNEPISNGFAKAAAPAQFASSSVLSGGNWYKVGVAQDGMYRITYNDLQEMGMDVNSIDPRKLNVYGNGGGMLPQSNNVFRHDDLSQTAIQVVGEADGSFDQGDYIVFYGKGPHGWVADSTSCGNYRHINNVYSDLAYYFVTADRNSGRRVASVPSAGASATHTVTKFDDHRFHESDNSNLLKSGREWFGEEFDLQLSHNLDFGFPNVASDPGYLSTRLLAKSTVGTSFSVRVNGSTVENVNVPSAPGGYNKNAEDEFTCTEHQFTSGNTNVAFNYSKGGNPSAIGWLDYLEIVLKRNLTMAGGQMGFRDLSSVGVGNIADFQVGGANTSLQVWEVTDPTNVSKRDLTLNGSTASFKVEADSLREFIAFNGSSFLSPDLFGAVENQNLHGLSQADMFIVCHPNFWSQAERLAEFHRTSETNPLSVHIVSPEQIFNEFSSGAQDVSAIRDFMRMFYE